VGLTRPDHAVCVELDVPFHHCDPLFVVWHGRYLEYLEASRQALLRSRGLDVDDIRELGYRMFVTDVRCRYTHPAGYGDRLEVTSWFAAGGSLVKVLYDVFNKTRGRRSARASTVLALTDAGGTLLTDLPAPVRERLPELSA
jgi:acyl-CoA thioester hydrolase